MSTRVTSVQFLPHATLKIFFTDGTSFVIEGRVDKEKVCGIENVKITRGSKLLAEHLGKQSGPPEISRVDVDELEGLLPYLEQAMKYVPSDYSFPEIRDKDEKESAIALARLFHIHTEVGIKRLRERLGKAKTDRNDSS